MYTYMINDTLHILDMYIIDDSVSTLQRSTDILTSILVAINNSYWYSDISYILAISIQMLAYILALR